MKRHPFNLVEIALATAVLGVGVASVLALFPVGASTSRSAVAENTVADVAEFFFGYFQNQYQANWKTDGSAASGLFTPATCPAFDSAPSSVPTGSSGFTFPDPGATPKPAFPNLGTHSTPGIFLYRQGNDAENPDFEAMIRVGKVTNNADKVRYPGIGSKSGGEASGYRQTAVSGVTNQLAGASSTVSKYLTSLLIEFSWPIDAPWEEREKRVYRLDFFNEMFEPYTPTPAAP